MKPLTDWPDAQRRAILGVFTDIDDTLTTEGAVPPPVVQALADLRSAGLHVIPITGRPVGWSEPFAATWPVDAIVAENGAVALVPDQNQSQPLSGGHFALSKLYQQDASTRASQFVRMQQAARRVLREVPGTQLSGDSAGRETDIAIDHSEFCHLPPERVREVVRILQDEGMTATVSSIHINGWYGAHHKLSGARWIVRSLFGRDLDAELARWVYVGDSTNDQLMFEHFPHSVGVANIRRFEAELTHKPRYITRGARGEGFIEVAQALLGAR
ncbi:MAG: HAD-IIB family hydrolase [Ramlibacter sp.]|nr:HAD-IIB family hydrolase [Ramlibacter sp.]